MNVHPGLRMGKGELLAWVQTRGERYELVKGRVAMMTGGLTRPRDHCASAVLLREIYAGTTPG
jgi:hypothetical protein